MFEAPSATNSEKRWASNGSSPTKSCEGHEGLTTCNLYEKSWAWQSRVNVVRFSSKGANFGWGGVGALVVPWEAWSFRR